MLFTNDEGSIIGFDSEKDNKPAPIAISKAKWNGSNWEYPDLKVAIASNTDESLKHLEDLGDSVSIDDISNGKANLAIAKELTPIEFLTELQKSSIVPCGKITKFKNENDRNEVSVLIPAFGKGKWVNDAIKSAFEQTLLPRHVIVLALSKNDYESIDVDGIIADLTTDPKTTGGDWLVNGVLDEAKYAKAKEEFENKKADIRRRLKVFNMSSKDPVESIVQGLKACYPETNVEGDEGGEETVSKLEELFDKLFRLGFGKMVTVDISKQGAELFKYLWSIVLFAYWFGKTLSNDFQDHTPYDSTWFKSAFMSGINGVNCSQDDNGNLIVSVEGSDDTWSVPQKWLEGDELLDITNALKSLQENIHIDTDYDGVSDYISSNPADYPDAQHILKVFRLGNLDDIPVLPNGQPGVFNASMSRNLLAEVLLPIAEAVDGFFNEIKNSGTVDANALYKVYAQRYLLNEFFQFNEDESIGPVYDSRELKALQFVFLDGDDVLAPNFLEEVTSMDADVVAAPIKGLINLNPKRCTAMTTNLTMLLNTDVWNDVGGCRLEYGEGGEDNALIYRIFTDTSWLVDVNTKTWYEYRDLDGCSLTTFRHKYNRSILNLFKGSYFYKYGYLLNGQYAYGLSDYRLSDLNLALKATLDEFKNKINNKFRDRCNNTILNSNIADKLSLSPEVYTAIMSGTVETIYRLFGTNAATQAFFATYAHDYACGDDYVFDDLIENPSQEVVKSFERSKNEIESILPVSYFPTIKVKAQPSNLEGVCAELVQKSAAQNFIKEAMSSSYRYASMDPKDSEYQNLPICQNEEMPDLYGRKFHVYAYGKPSAELFSGGELIETSVGLGKLRRYYINEQATKEDQEAIKSAIEESNFESLFKSYCVVFSDEANYAAAANHTIPKLKDAINTNRKSGSKLVMSSDSSTSNCVELIKDMYSASKAPWFGKGSLKKEIVFSFSFFTKCNKKCHYCNQAGLDSNPDESTLKANFKQCLKIINNAWSEAGLEGNWQATILGGEITLCSDNFAKFIMDELGKRPVKLATNGYKYLESPFYEYPNLTAYVHLTEPPYDDTFLRPYDSSIVVANKKDLPDIIEAIRAKKLSQTCHVPCYEGRDPDLILSKDDIAALNEALHDTYGIERPEPTYISQTASPDNCLSKDMLVFPIFVYDMTFGGCCGYGEPYKPMSEFSISALRPSGEACVKCAQSCSKFLYN